LEGAQESVAQDDYQNLDLHARIYRERILPESRSSRKILAQESVAKESYKKSSILVTFTKNRSHQKIGGANRSHHARMLRKKMNRRRILSFLEEWADSSSFSSYSLSSVPDEQLFFPFLYSSRSLSGHYHLSLRRQNPIPPLQYFPRQRILSSVLLKIPSSVFTGGQIPILFFTVGTDSQSSGSLSGSSSSSSFHTRPY